MSSTNKYYDLAALAEASYVYFQKLENFSDDKIKIALINNPSMTNGVNYKGNFSPSQANEFVESWDVVYHQANTGSGFSATLFQNTDCEYVYALRGTEQPILDLIEADFNDIVTDGLAINQIVDMVNDWQRINTNKNGVYQAAYLELQQERTDLLLEERYGCFNLGIAWDHPKDRATRATARRPSLKKPLKAGHYVFGKFF